MPGGYAAAPAPAAPVGAAPAPVVGPPPANPTRAVLQGSAGVFTVTPGIEMRVGRDGNNCAILLSDPAVSSIHATVRLDNGQLWVRDENSNNGSFLNGARLGAGQWAAVPHGAVLHFGSSEFSARLE